ncbi:MAG TPA: nucleotidyltransferase family protein [Bacteroidales bacterium]|jgi:hypothetical protein|nr:nucleotidyltransferase family protein [Bacteroidales bacterium]
MLHNKEIKLLLEIATEPGNNAISLAGMNIQQLMQLAFRHKTVYHLHVFAHKNSHLFSKEQLKNIEERSRRSAIQSLVQLYELKKIARTLDDNGISYCCIKGPQLSRMLYGREALKESVDLDIILGKASDLQQVHELFYKLGYSVSNLNEYPGKWRRKIFLIAKREVHYYNRENNCAIDLHIRPGANTYLTEKYFKGFLTGLKTYDLEGTPIPVLQDESYFVYLCYHGALHQFSRLAWLLDIRAFLIMKETTLNFDTVHRIARSLNIERCVILALLLLEKYFGDAFISKVDYSLQTKLMHLLAADCYEMLRSQPGYALSLKGRYNKVIYIMKLIKGLPGKIDWFYGIFMRQVIKVIRS